MIKLNWVCFGNCTGYSQAAQDMVFALSRSGRYDLRLEFLFPDMPQSAGMSDDRWSAMRAMAQKPLDASAITVYHCIPTAQRQARRRTLKSIGFATFETYKPPNEGVFNWIEILNRNNAIVAPSLFNYKIFANENIVKPLFYVPHGVDFELFNPEVEPLTRRDRFTFLFFGSWRRRKGYVEMLEAFYREFGPDDGVQLIIKTDRIAEAQKVAAVLKRDWGLGKKEIAPILYESTVFTERTLPQFLRSVDCLVSPTMGEGFGLPGLQCMAVKTPVVITNFSGCQDYANAETAFLLEPRGFVLKPALDEPVQFRNKKWAFIAVEDIRKQMRRVLNNPSEAKAKADAAYEYVKKHFNYDNVVRAFDEAVESVE